MISEFTSRVVGVLRRTSARDPNVAAFVRHNEAVFGPPSSTADGVVLFEYNPMHSAHIAYSYLANVLAEKYSARIEAFSVKPLSGWRYLWRSLADRFLNAGPWRVYRSFGARRLIFTSIGPRQRARAEAIFADVTSRLGSKRDAEELVVEGIWIGDLVYDTYLMGKRKPTIDLASAEFRDFLLESIETLVFWLEYFDGHDVRAVNVSHCVYNSAMPMRIAAKRGIPAFQINATHAYRLTKDRLFAYGDYVDFPTRFKELPEEVREEGLAEAASRIARRFTGEVGVDMSYSTKSAYGRVSERRLLRESGNAKVLVATHCFFDSPHSYGNNLFPDFWEWLEFLGKLTSETSFDWYIKTHPDYLPGTKEIIDGFVARYPRFTLLPAESSHNQLIAEGIGTVLTVYGTIGFEYAARGIPVINASLCNPHVAYGFNLHPSNLKEYEAAVRSIGHNKLTIDRRSVDEYYYMRHIYNTEDIFFSDYSATVERLGGYSAQFTSAIYAEWLAEWTPSRHGRIIDGLRRFVDSGDFRLDYRHFADGLEAAKV